MDTFHEPLPILLISSVPGTLDGWTAPANIFSRTPATFRRAYFHSPLAFCSTALLLTPALGHSGRWEQQLCCEICWGAKTKRMGVHTLWDSPPTPKRWNLWIGRPSPPGTACLELQFPAPLRSRVFEIEQSVVPDTSTPSFPALPSTSYGGFNAYKL